MIQDMRTLQREGEIYHCLYAQQFDRSTLDRLCRLADALRAITKTKTGDDFVATLLSNKRAMIYFAQPSTRTFLSFMSACRILGISPIETRDPRVLSETKGESWEDTVRTFASYVDLLILRHSEEALAEKAAWVLNAGPRPVPVINAGSGKDQHPTQALLDVYTLTRYLKSLDGKHLVLVGDLRRGRTIRSLCYLMKNFPGVSLNFVSPPEFTVSQDVLDFLNHNRISYRETDDLESALAEADAVYMTRVQDEYDAADESRRVDLSRFRLRAAHLRKMKPEAILMHPLPRRDEIEPEVDKDPRAVYFRQERNGLWIRAALIALIFRLEKRILEARS